MEGMDCRKSGLGGLEGQKGASDATQGWFTAGSRPCPGLRLRNEQRGVLGACRGFLPGARTAVVPPCSLVPVSPPQNPAVAPAGSLGNSQVRRDPILLGAEGREGDRVTRGGTRPHCGVRETREGPVMVQVGACMGATGPEDGS